MTTRHGPSFARLAALSLSVVAAFVVPACRAPSAPVTRVILPSATSRQFPAPNTAPASAAAASQAAVASQAASEAQAASESQASAEPAPEPPTRFARVELVRFHTRLSRDLPPLKEVLLSVLADDGTRALRPGSLWFGDASHAVPDALWNSSPARSVWHGLVAWRGAEHLQLQLDGLSNLALDEGTQLLIDLRPAETEQHWAVRLRVRGPGADIQQAMADDDSDSVVESDYVELRAEDVVLQPLQATAEQTLTLLLPSPFDDGWLGLRVSPETPTPAAAEAALAAREQRLADRGFVRPAPAGAGLAAVVSAGLDRYATRRATLQHAAASVKLTLLAELCLVAPDALIDAIGRATQARMNDGGKVSLRTLLGGTVDGLAHTQLPEADATVVSAVLREHLGALDTRRDLLADALPSLVSEAALESFLRRENALLLEDNRSSARLRAFEWLSRRKLAPEGYEPLAPSAERRAALLAAAEAAL